MGIPPFGELIRRWWIPNEVRRVARDVVADHDASTPVNGSMVLRGKVKRSLTVHTINGTFRAEKL